MKQLIFGALLVISLSGCSIVGNALAPEQELARLCASPATHNDATICVAAIYTHIRDVANLTADRVRQGAVSESTGHRVADGLSELYRATQVAEALVIGGDLSTAGGKLAVITAALTELEQQTAGGVQ